MAELKDNIKLALSQNALDKLNPEDRLEYYNSVCESLGLNPLTQPLDYITLNGKLRLYAKKDATDQLRRIYEVSVDETKHDHRESLGLYVVTALGHGKGGRKDTGTGAVSIKGLTGEALANAIMKTETKAKRRFTLSICGLGFLDETELETIPTAHLAPVAAAPTAPVVPEVNHTPATPTNEARPNESKPTKEEPKTLTEVLLKNEKTEEYDPNRVTSVVPLDNKGKVAAPVQKMDGKPSSERARHLIEKGVEKDNLRKYALKHSGAEATNKITKDQWDELLTPLETALASGGKDAANTHINQYLA